MEGPAQILFSNIDYDPFVGRIGVGRVERGTVKNGMPLVLCCRDGKPKTPGFPSCFQYQGLGRAEAETARLGDIIAVAGLDGGWASGETACSPESGGSAAVRPD